MRYCQSLKVILNRTHTFQIAYAALFQIKSMSRKEKYYDKRDTYIITHKLKLSQKNPNTLHSSRIVRIYSKNTNYQKFSMPGGEVKLPNKLYEVVRKLSFALTLHLFLTG